MASVSDLYHTNNTSVQALSAALQNGTSAAAEATAENNEDLQAAPARSFGRAAGQMRPVELVGGVMKNADGSCLVSFGDTQVLCSATIEQGVPRWREGQRAGWVTAEYAMLPASTGRRTPREYRGRKGRSQEIERLVGRSLRAAVDLRALGELTVTLDCDVLQADGGTRTASITGAWVALHDALMKWVDAGRITRLPLTRQVAAISCGVVAGELLCDLDYPEDSHAEVDCNIVACTAPIDFAAPASELSPCEFIEVQGTGEKNTFSRAQLNSLFDLAEPALMQLFEAQNNVTGFRD